MQMSKWTADFREVSRRPRLPALAGVRIFAALHIYFFHVKQAHDSGLLSFSAISALPAPLASLVGRGHVSTGLFFQLSGFLLAYAYLDSSGRPKTTDWTFWRGRFVRLYPLYFLSLLLLVPAPALLPFTAKHSTTAEVASGVLSSLTLTQAWFPAFALWWNAPAWALSAFAAFYAIFPAFSRWTAGLGQRGLMGLVIALTLLSWVPAGAYMLLNPADDGWTATSITLGGPWLMALRFNPLSWLPQFLAGVALGRMFGMRVDRGKIEPGRRAGLWPSAGDALALGILCLLAFARQVPYVPLRHGLLAPFSLVVINDLAHGRGLLARFLSWRGFGRLSEASFSLFALQMPAGVWFCVATLSSATGTTAHLVAMIAWTLGLAVIWSELAQRPMIERSRRGKRASPGDGWPAPLSPDHRRVVRFSVRRWYFMTDQ
jgi:peptidoglycan/LPS O-acetylase OafA/YrhL